MIRIECVTERVAFPRDVEILPAPPVRLSHPAILWMQIHARDPRPGTIGPTHVEGAYLTREECVALGTYLLERAMHETKP